MLPALERIVAEALAPLVADGVQLLIGPGPAPTDGPALTVVARGWRLDRASSIAGEASVVDLRLVAWGRSAPRADALLRRAAELALAALADQPDLGGPFASTGERRGYDEDRRLVRVERRLRGGALLRATAAPPTPDPTPAPQPEPAPPPAPSPPPAPPPTPARRTGPRPLERLAPVRLKALGDTSASHLSTVFQVGTLEGLAALGDAQIDGSGLSASARSTLKSGRSQAASLLALELDPWVPVGLGSMGLGALAALSDEALLASAVAAGGVAGDGLRAGLASLREALSAMSTLLDASWFGTAEATLGVLVRDA